MAARYLFDHDFTAPRQTTPTVPMITVEQHESRMRTAEAEAYQRGLAEGRRVQQDTDDHYVGRTLGELDRRLPDAIAAAAPHVQNLERDAVDLALALARKIGGAAIERFPLLELERLASECFAELRGAPHFVVRVNDALVEAAKERLQPIAAMNGFSGRLVVLGDPDIAKGDARCEWADGGFVRDQQTVNAAIERAVARHFAPTSSGDLP